MIPFDDAYGRDFVHDNVVATRGDGYLSSLPFVTHLEDREPDLSVYMLICLPERGAYYPTFALAHALESQGHRVLYLGREEFRDDVERQGLKFLTMFPGSPSQDPNVGEIPTNLIRKLLWYRQKIAADPQRFRLLKAMVNGDIEAILQGHHVDLVLLDPFLHPLAAICVNARIRVVSMATELMNNRDYSIPPNNTVYAPTNSSWSRIVSYSLWLRFFLYSYLWRALLFVAMKIVSWPTAPRELTRAAKAQQKRSLLRWMFSEYSWRVILPEFVLCPRAFEFPSASSSTRRYFGVTIDRHRVDVPFDHEIPAEKKLIYASLGTHAAIYGKRVDRFIELLIEVAKTTPSCHFLINIGKGNEPAKFGEVPENVLLKTFVPQLEILDRSAAMITNGGLGTVKEAIMAQVPLLVVPCRWDQFGNAARVKQHGIGNICMLPKITVPIIQKCLDDLLKNPRYKTQLARMKQQIEQNDEFAKGLQWLNEVATQPHPVTEG